MLMEKLLPPDNPKLGGCDNVDCKNYHVSEVWLVVLRQEFDFEVCWWCIDCIKRDEDMIYMDEYHYSLYFDEFFDISNEVND